MKFSIRHAALFSFDKPRKLAVQALRLTPGSSGRQRVLAWNLSLPAKAMERADAYGNLTHLLSLDKPHQQLLLEAEGLIETQDVAELMPENLSPLVFLRPSDWTRMGEPLQAFVESCRGPIEARLLPGLEFLSQKLTDRLTLSAELLPPVSAMAAFNAGRCSRIGLAHVLLACCRYLKIPARFVSGYRYSRQQPASPYCWVEIWNGQSWSSFDPAESSLTDGGYLKLAVGLDHGDSCSVRFAEAGQAKVAEQLEIQLLSR